MKKRRSISLSDDTWTLLCETAKKEHRSVSSLVRKLIADAYGKDKQ